ncbi:MAG: PIN domain-containing protein [Candidatus Omnitrophica bacterium]|nr:PIN domain-containing protein [Candidatus Omnitrophota bacterium]
MSELEGILADTSIWVHFFRSAGSREAAHLDGLLQARLVRTCPPIRVEVISGARTERERMQLRELFSAIPSLDLPDDFWGRIEESRFSLARKGIQAKLIDLMIAAVTQHHNVPLWTLDDDFSLIRSIVPFPRYIPEV